MLLRSGDGTWRVRPLRNALQSRTSYAFDSREWLGVLQEAEARGEHLAWIFHSHVDTGAYFSAEDRHQAAPGGEPLLPGVGYLVIAVHSGCVKDTGIFWWECGGFRERPFSRAFKSSQPLEFP